MADISRSDVATLIEDAYSHVLLDAAVQGSTALQAFPTVNLGTKTTHMPVLATLPAADWVSETQTKPTSEVTWKDLTMVVEELAVIVPVHENVLDDATTDILAQIVALAGQSIGKKLDQAVFFGIGKPASWVSNDLFSACNISGQIAGNDVGAANIDDIVGCVNQAGRTIASVGLMPDVLIAPLTFRYDVANIRDGLGAPIFRDEQFSGYATYFNRNGAWEPDEVLAFVADSSRVRIGIRQDIQVKYLDQATVNGINLAERDMVALRFKARYAYVLGISTTSLGNDVTPVAAVVPEGSGS